MIARAPNVIPFGVVKDLERLYEENPRVMEMFAAAIAAPTHTQNVTLCFQGGKLCFGKHDTTVK